MTIPGAASLNLVLGSFIFPPNSEMFLRKSALMIDGIPIARQKFQHQFETRPMKSKFHRCIAHLLLYVIALNAFMLGVGSISTVEAQRRVIVVNAEQPNLWTLEQAHYLLAQMHRRNLDLKAKSVGELDPNEIAGLRFDVMRMMIEFGATFNQADLATNRLLSENRSFNAERRQELLTERDGLRRDSLRLTGEIEELEIEKANTDDEDAKKKIDSRIAAKQTRLAKVDKEIEQLNSELGTITAPSGDPKATTGGATFSKEKLPDSEFDEAFKAAAKKQIEKFNDSPQLNASLRLDNFLQMQYEIISKQLSLLRDEIGPGERLVFLEMPQTVNAAHHESNKKWAQSWWKIAGYTYREHVGPAPAVAPSPRPKDSYEPITTTRDMESIFSNTPFSVPLNPCYTQTPITYPNTNAITVGTDTSKIVVGKASGRVTQVSVTLHGFRHRNPDDVDLMLVGPDGQNALILSDVGGMFPANDLTINLSDTAAAPLPDAGPLTNGNFLPTNQGAASDSFPAPAPTPLGGSALSIFNGTDPNGSWTLYSVDDNGPSTGSISGGWSLTITTGCPNEPDPRALFRDRFVDLNAVPAPLALATYLNPALNPHPPLVENRSVRTVELIPRQSSLNVNDMKLRTRAGAFNFVLSTLFGFGSQLNVQRQREQFTQFVQQELYSAAFGKGSREFGWTFTPMPGTDRLQSGVRTTYAIVVVPDNATSLVLETNGCYFPRSSHQPIDFKDTKSDDWNELNRSSRNCGVTEDGNRRSKAFVVPIPAARLDGGNEFWVDKINFAPVAKGKRIVVAISGKNFSPQIGALIDGVPLLHSIGLAQPLIRDDSVAGRATSQELSTGEVKGQIERIDTDKIILSFSMPADYSGTPTITLVAPGRATNLNDLQLVINREPNKTLDEFPTKMFGNSPKPDDFRIDRVRVFRGPADQLTALISGAGFVNAGAGLPRVLVNGGVPLFTAQISATLMRVVFDPPTDPSIKVTMTSQNLDPLKRKTIESESVPNPAFLSVSDVEVIVYEAATEDEPATLVVKITGTGFTDKLKTSIGDIAVKSATEAVLTITDPKAASVVTLEDEDTGQKVKAVITRKSKAP